MLYIHKSFDKLTSHTVTGNSWELCSRENKSVGKMFAYELQYTRKP